MNTINRLFSLAASCAAISGCVVVPYPVADTVETVDQATLDKQIVVTAGPRRMIEAISERVQDRDPDIDIMPPVEFRDAAFPDGGWTLAALLTEASNDRRVRTGARYLIVVGSDPITTTGEDKGGYVPALAGVMYTTQTSTLTGTLIDLQTAEPVRFFRVSAEGTPAAAIWIVVSAVKYPMTESAVLNGFAEALVGEIRQAMPSGPVRVAMLAAEGSRNPFGFAPRDAAPLITADQ